MQDDLKIFKVYSETQPEKIDKFASSVSSEYIVGSNYEKVEADFAWLDIMEDTIRYLDNILRNPNRFIINEEEIVKVEQARRVTVESIKHLAKHTNFIQEIEANGDVRPSKILNINKDESYNTYENRVIYTLINNMRTFVELKEKAVIKTSSLKDEKKCEYNGVSRIGSEKVSISLVLNAKTNYDKKDGYKDGLSVEQRIAKLKLRISDLTNMPVYVALAREHVARVIPPVKKTNLILKNTNFQYAMKLWDFLQTYRDDGNKNVKERRTIKDDSNVRQMLDDVFLLNYLAVSSISTGDSTLNAEAQAEAAEELTNKMIDKIIEINANLPVEKLEEIIGDKLAIIKSRKEASLAEIEHKFNDRIELLTDRILEYKFR